MNRIEFHAHLALDGIDYKAAMARHQPEIGLSAVRAVLKTYQNAGFTAVRDGGDPAGISLAAKALAAEYGLSVASPAFAIYKKGNYGSILGKGFASDSEYRSLIAEVRSAGGTFIKLVLSGIMDFDHGGRSLYYEHPLGADEIMQMVHVAHSEGFAVMAHVNGRDNILMALEAGCDSIEHGYGMDEGALQVMIEQDAFWVPTLAPLALFKSPDPSVRRTLNALLKTQRGMIRKAAAMGARVLPGSDAGSAFVPHAQGWEKECQELSPLLANGCLPSPEEQKALFSRFFVS